MRTIYSIPIFLRAGLLLLLAAAAGSCRKFVQIPPAPNLIGSSQVFSDSADVDAAVLAMYVTMNNPYVLTPYNGNITVFGGLSSDEIYTTRGTNFEKILYSNNLTPTTLSLGDVWYNSYLIIYKANAILEGLSSPGGVSLAAKNQLMGEAKLVRAMLYFHLVNLYGGVPLVTRTDFETNSLIPRSTTDSVYRLIVSDLVSAVDLLPEGYPTAGRVRPNRYTAAALLSRVYLYQGSWQQAEEYAGRIIGDSSTYSLAGDLNDVFLSSTSVDNREAIWQLLPTLSGYETTEGYFFVPSTTTAVPRYVISNFLLDAFEAGDQRKVKWLRANTVNGKDYYYPYKYKLGRDANSAPLESYMVFRLGEQYLIRAEARAQQGKLVAGLADLNRIRERAGLADTTAAAREELLSEINHERQTELFCEWGHRWYDLKRTGQVDAVMSVVTPAKGGNWSSFRGLFPIAQADLNRNQSLLQNPGYN